MAAEASSLSNALDLTAEEGPAIHTRVAHLGQTGSVAGHPVRVEPGTTGFAELEIQFTLTVSSNRAAPNLKRQGIPQTPSGVIKSTTDSLLLRS